MPFEITSPSIIHCGAGTFAQIPDEAARLGRRVAIVTGAHLLHSRRIADLYEALRKRGVHVSIAQPITDEPTVEMVDELALYLREERSEVVISVGGGSVIDTAKAAAAMATASDATGSRPNPRKT